MKNNRPILHTIHNVKIKDFIGEEVFYDESDAIIFIEDEDGRRQIIAEIGMSAIAKLFKNKDSSIDLKKAEDFQDNLGHLIAEAINDKLELITFN